MGHEPYVPPREGDRVSMEGHFTHLIYGNDEGFVIADFEEEGTLRQYTAKGTVIPFRPFQPMRIAGRWTRHPKYKLQVAMDSYELMRPNSPKAVAAYIGSGMVPGLGEVMAERIVEAFGDDTLRVLEEEPERLSSVKGVGHKLVESVRQHFGKDDAEQDAMLYLMELGLTAKRAAKAFRHFGPEAKSLIQANPYRLTEVSGVGFPLADSIALGLGWELTHPKRVQEGIRHFLWQGCNGGGHAFLKELMLVSVCSTELRVPYEAIDDGLSRLAGHGSIVIEGGDVYPRHYHDVEVSVARVAARPARSGIEREGFDGLLAEFEAATKTTLEARQRDGIRLALTSPLSVITGGPGTGKTTTLRAVLDLAAKYGIRTACMSPTGRAAKRMAEVTGKPAGTIHRTLGLRPDDGDGDTDTSSLVANPTSTYEAADLVVLDEGSMLDLPLSGHVTANLGKKSLLLVGDVDQLPSVGPGRVLKDIIDSGAANVTVLDHIFRQAAESDIVIAAMEVNAGRVPDLRGTRDFRFTEIDDSSAIGRYLTTTLMPSLLAEGHDPARDVQVLSPMKKGAAGTVALNVLLQAYLNPLRDGDAEVETKGGASYRRNDRVMQTRNDYDKLVFNGEQGFVADVNPYSKRMLVDFGEGKVVEYGFGEIAMSLLHAYAVTVHKAQGSEYPVVVMVATTAHHVMLERNLVYTGITRARDLMHVVGQRRALAIAVANDKPVTRNTRLARRIREMAAGR